ncbi:MAG: hypothetical protein PHU86_04330 [Patescibacteria group bacterium]|nr:hypothetical protein [Patescibacteria group bacterium]
MALGFINIVYAADTITPTKGCTGGFYTKGIMNGLPCDQPLSNINDIVMFVKNLTLGYILPLVGTIFIIMLIIGGILYITSRGNQQQVDRGKKTLTTAIIGLLIIILSYTIIAIFTKVMGGNVGTISNPLNTGTGYIEPINNTSSPTGTGGGMTDGGDDGGSGGGGGAN